MAITKVSDAKESGFAQVREALQMFEGDVVSAEFGQWGGTLFDDNGKPLPPKEFFEISCVNVKVLEAIEELAIPIEEWSFRVNCSNFKGSFWVDKFLASADRNKLLIPDDLVGKRIVFKKETLEARDPKYNSTNFVIVGIKEEATADQPVTPQPQQEASTVTTSSADPMDIALELAIGKTEAQFRSAVTMDPYFSQSELLPLAKAGNITKMLVEQGKLVLAKEGNREVYRKP